MTSAPMLTVPSRHAPRPLKLITDRGIGRAGWTLAGWEPGTIFCGLRIGTAPAPYFRSRKACVAWANANGLYPAIRQRSGGFHPCALAMASPVLMIPV